MAHTFLLTILASWVFCSTAFRFNRMPAKAFNYRIKSTLYSEVENAVESIPVEPSTKVIDESSPPVQAESKAKTPSENKQPDNKYSLFVGNIPTDKKAKEVEAFLKESVKNFKSFRLLTKEGQETNFGFINFADEESFKTAYESTKSGITYNGQLLTVRLSKVTQQSKAVPQGGAPNFKRPRITPQNDPDNTVFVGNIDFSVTDEQFQEMCDDILGKAFPYKVKMSKNKETQQSRGFVHIELTNPTDAKKVVEELTGVELLGRALTVNLVSQKKPPRSETAKVLFLGNLPFNISEQLLSDMLTDVLGSGTFSNIRIQIDRETNRSKGFAYVDVVDAEVAERALVELNGIELIGRPLKADLAERKPSSKRGPRE